MSKTKQPLERIARKGQSHTRRSVIRWIKRGLLAATAGGIIAALVIAMLPEPVVVDVAPITEGPLEVEIREDGQTRVRDRFVIAAPITGQLERIELEAGARIEAGTTVARIEPPSPGLLDDRSRGELTARLAAARAREKQASTAVARARYARDAAIKDATRTRKLEEAGVSTKVEREHADLAERIAIQDLAAAELARNAAAAEIEALRATLEPRPAARAPLAVTSPAAGSVLRLLRESAGPVTAGTPLIELGDPTGLEVVIDVLSRDAERIRPGMTVELSTAAVAPLLARVRLVEPAAFTRVSALGVEEQRVNVVAALTDPAPALGDAFRVDARIILWRGDRVRRAPSSALFRDGDAWAVYTLEHGKARTRHVEVGHRGRLDVEITGLEVGTQVIAHPSDRTRDGVRVTARE